MFNFFKKTNNLEEISKLYKHIIKSEMLNQKTHDTISNTLYLLLKKQAEVNEAFVQELESLRKEVKNLKLERDNGSK